jgi:hypothetical protein
MHAWPELPIDEWNDTCETLQLWLQMAGKVRMALTPAINHYWHVPLYLTARGLTTSPMPVPDGPRSFQLDFDLVEHRFELKMSDGASSAFDLAPMTVSAFYEKFRGVLGDHSIDVKIRPIPSEVADPIPFAEDARHASYDAEYATRFFRVLLGSVRVMTEFRSKFIGKVSPVHFFWGANDLAVTRFSGRRAPRHPGAPGLPDAVTQESYSHEVSSAGFWPGGGGAGAAFYSYAYPEPKGYAQSKVKPEAAFYSVELREFLLPYDAVRTSDDPDATLMQFLDSTYAAAADPGAWDRAALER